MGLDVYAYQKLTQVNPEDIALDGDGYPIDYVRYIRFGSFDGQEQIWPGRSEPLNQYGDESYFECLNCDNMRAGSYSTYNEWRGILLDFANEVAVNGASDAFAELIDFSDCDGVIGSIVSDKLYNDFVENRDFADEFADEYFGDDDEEREWWLAKYDGWCSMFDMARDDGCVVFC